MEAELSSIAESNSSYADALRRVQEAHHSFSRASALGGTRRSWREGLAGEIVMPSNNNEGKITLPSLTPERTTESPEELYSNLKPGQLSRELNESGIIDWWIEEMPWTIIQRGINEGGVFEIIASQEAEDQGFPWFLGKNVEEDFRNNIPLALDYFETKESAEEFLNRFASPMFDSSLQRTVWPASIEPLLRKQYEELLERRKKKERPFGVGRRFC
ncbi:MAG: hypothetical protein G01um101448_896 [Parcubacteria group bacterium Gr01-1014_48]|nr:MAG: hypothetical protein Greene041614_524 [Parcubacteria group bacterium Greene0416_14]TSC72911.1 MAG: hypothetical protein G01um101448_896 [Parcubacteria group bacterium Gr01-1014_48]TSD00539.1 MAG: hypothetical protein Greene101415_760 [Parcubacteria group bacterium Greene1014_15]TSD07771.1 MAG: hypothetical protein Greene07144_747 [Parcubacteria group bacterium Greene0714_4]